MRPTPGSILARAEAPAIVRRLLNTLDTVPDVAADYGCDPCTVLSIYRAATTPLQREHARRRKQSAQRKGVPTGRVPAHAYKPGTLRGMAARRWVPVGTVVIRKRPNKRPHRWIKVADVPHATGANWKLYATWLWEKANGPAPAGYRVGHADGNTLNDRPGNIVCAPKQSAALAAMSDPARQSRRIAKVAKARRLRAQWERGMREAAAQKRRAAA
jgi:hypothetical protein